MRISFFVPRCTPDNSHGRYVIELARRFVSQHSVTIYSGTFWPPLKSIVHCRRIPVINRPAFARLVTLWASSGLALRRRAADIVHIQGADAPVGDVVTAHCCNAAMQSAIRGGHTLLRRLNYRVGAVAERYIFSKRSTRTIIAVSNSVKQDILKHYGVDSSRIVVIPLGVNADDFHPDGRTPWRVEVRSRLSLGLEDFVVLFIGGDYRVKGLGPLLRAIGRVRDPKPKLLVVGVHPDTALSRFIAESELEHHVTFQEHTQQIAPLYAAADCFVLPTRYDTFSLVTLEAMASGLPVIVSRSAGVSEHLSHGRDALVLESVDDAEALAKHIERLMDDHSLRNNLAREARRTAERYSWEAVVAQTERAYAQMLSVS